MHCIAYFLGRPRPTAGQVSELQAAVRCSTPVRDSRSWWSVGRVAAYIYPHRHFVLPLCRLPPFQHILTVSTSIRS